MDHFLPPKNARGNCARIGVCHRRTSHAPREDPAGTIIAESRASEQKPANESDTEGPYRKEGIEQSPATRHVKASRKV
jgi:hypothetical protein